MINTDCVSCVFYQSECQHPDYDTNKPDTCPGYYSQSDAAEDSKLLHAEKG